jgi:hypothetical protein
MVPNTKPIAMRPPGLVPAMDNPAPNQSMAQPNNPLKPNMKGNTNMEVHTTGIIIKGIIGLITFFIGILPNRLTNQPALKPIMMAAIIPILMPLISICKDDVFTTACIIQSC